MDGFKILALGGDGIGPEVVDSALALLEAVSASGGPRFDISTDLLHGAAWDRYCTFCRDETLARARAVDAVLVGAVGGPKWDDIVIEGPPAAKDGLMRLRQELDVYAGLRPAKAYDSLLQLTPYRAEALEGADVMVLRELCGGVYFGEPRGIEAQGDGGHRGFDSTVYTTAEIERIARAGFELARRRSGGEGGRLLSTDKANVMESGVLWRQVVSEVGAIDYPDVALTHFYADNACYQLARDPKAFDVILGDNLFGDIISDQAGVIAGSLGMLPSASLACLPPEGTPAVPGIYEPVHGSAPDIAGQGIANPLGMLLSVAMMFDYGFALPAYARRIELAVEDALAGGARTADLGGEDSTEAMTAAVIRAYRAL